MTFKRTKTRKKPRAFSFEKMTPDLRYEIHVMDSENALQGCAYFIRHDRLVDDAIRILRTSRDYKHHRIIVCHELLPYVSKELRHEIQ